MPGFLLRRLGQALLTILGVVTLIFFVQRLTGDPTYLLVPETATQADIDALRHQLGFDRPLLLQYLDFLAELARFDLGQSVVQRVPVTTIISSRLPYTLMLAGGALTVACGIGVPIGILLAVFRESVGRERHDRWTNGSRMPPLVEEILDRPRRRQAIDDGHQNIHQNEIERRLPVEKRLTHGANRETAVADDR